jgi:thymidylate synthase
MMAQVSNLEVGELVHVIADAHIYDKHVPIIEELIKQEQHKPLTLEIDKTITNFYDFTVDSFKLNDYKHNTFKTKIPIAV